MQARAWLVLTIVAAGGCDTSEPPVERQSAEEEDDARESVFDPWVETIDRARGVQQTIEDAEAERRRQLEEAER